MLKTVFYCLFSVSFILTPLIQPSFVESKSISEIEEEIEAKEDELENLEESLQNAKEHAAYYENMAENASSEIERVENSIKQLGIEIESNQIEQEELSAKLDLKKLQLEKLNSEVGSKLKDLYISDRRGVVESFLLNEKLNTAMKDVQYKEALLNVDFKEITDLSQNISTLKDDLNLYEKGITALKGENEKLAEEKQELEDKINLYSSQASYNTNIQSGIRSQMKGVQQQIEGLNSEHKEMLEQMGQLFGEADSGGTLSLKKGQYYFYGIGHYNQGHGLGFSQYGAKGAAQAGWDADKIAKYYYSGSTIGTSGGNISVSGYGTMNIEDYVSGLGEIPDYACGTEEQYENNPNKYRVYNSNLWEGGCWPEEAIKAQIIVARSYALAYGGTICTTAACQVYKGGEAKSWSADETKGKVVKVGGSVIKAYYSSDNNNGWGTGTHRKPVWCWDFEGNCGGGFSWLQSVQDESFAAPGPYDNYVWRTNGYDLEDFDNMLEWYANSGNVYFSSVSNLKNSIGKVKGFNMVRDSSGRVHKILVKGTNSNKYINGEKFQYIWLKWNSATDPSGQNSYDGGRDYIYSLTYYFIQHN